MKLKSLDIQGYKSIRENQQINLTELNVLLGKNNVGKSSIIDALRDYQEIFPVANQIYSGWAHSRNTGKQRQGEIRFELEFELSPEEHREFLEAVDEVGNIGDERLKRWIEDNQFRQITHELTIHSDPIPNEPVTGESNMLANFDGGSVPLRKGSLNDGKYFDFNKPNSDDLTDKRREWVQLKSVMEKSINSWGFIEAFRNPEGMVKATRQVDLDGTGENLSKVLLTLRGEKGDEFQTISDEYSDIMAGVDGIRAPLPEDDQTTIVVDEEEYGTGFELDEVSAGSKEVLTLITKIVLSKESTDLLFIEEPELHLHPGAERKILDLINRELVGEGPQVIISTHSSVFIHHLDVENVYRVKREADTELLHTSSSQIGADLRELGYEYAGMFQSEAVVIVEGLTDRVALRTIGPKYGLDFDDHNIGILELGSGSQLVKHSRPVVRLLEVFNIPYFFLCDSDIGGELTDENGNPAEGPTEIEGRMIGRINDDSSRQENWSDATIDNVHAWRQTELEHYLLQDKDALNTAFGSLDSDDIQTILDENEDADPDERLEELCCEARPHLDEISDPMEKRTDIHDLASAVSLDKLPTEFHNVMEDIADLVDARSIVADARPPEEEIDV